MGESSVSTYRQVQAACLSSHTGFNTAAAVCVAASFDSRGDGVISARVHMYEGEDQCELHKRIFLKCIEHVSKSSPNAFAAIKVTALGRPDLLLRVSEILRHTTHLFQTVAVDGHGAQVLHRDIGNTHPHMRHTVSPEQLQALLARLGTTDSETIAKTLFSQMDSNNDGQIDYIEWLSLLQVTHTSTLRICLMPLANAVCVCVCVCVCV